MAGQGEEPGLQALTSGELVDAAAGGCAAVGAERCRRVRLAADTALTIAHFGMSFIGLTLAQDVCEVRVGTQHFAELEIADLEKVHHCRNRPSR